MGAAERYTRYATDVPEIFQLRNFEIRVDSLANRHQARWRFPLPVRVVLLSLFLLTLPAWCQQSSVSQHTPGGNWSPTIVRPEPPRDLNPEAFRFQSINQDAEELSALSAMMQSDLSQLRKGVLSKELEQNLKKMEKLAKKLRQEVNH